MIILVRDFKEVQVGQYTNLEVTGMNTKTQKETTQTIYSTLKEKWGLAEKDKLIELVMENKGTKEKPRWQVKDIKLPPTAEPIEKDIKLPPTAEPIEKESNHLVKEAVKMGAEVISDEKMTKEDWAKKETTTRKSIERQKALECSVMLCQSSQIQPQEILTYAEQFEKYLETGSSK